MEKLNKQVPTSVDESTGEKISRKEALKKAGYYAASAAGLMLLLGKPQKAMAASPSPPPAW
jgi:hypothetical protein